MSHVELNETENLYQICVASASDNVVEALQKQQYNVTVIQR